MPTPIFRSSRLIRTGGGLQWVGETRTGELWTSTSPRRSYLAAASGWECVSDPPQDVRDRQGNGRRSRSDSLTQPWNRSGPDWGAVCVTSTCVFAGARGWAARQLPSRTRWSLETAGTSRTSKGVPRGRPCRPSPLFLWVRRGQGDPCLGLRPTARSRNVSPSRWQQPDAPCRGRGSGGVEHPREPRKSTRTDTTLPPAISHTWLSANHPRTRAGDHGRGTDRTVAVLSTPNPRTSFAFYQATSSVSFSSVNHCCPALRLHVPNRLFFRGTRHSCGLWLTPSTRPDTRRFFGRSGHCRRASSSTAHPRGAPK